MNSKKLLILLAVAALVGGAAVVAYKNQFAARKATPRSSVVIGDKLLPNIMNKIEEIQSVVVDDDTGGSITLVRGPENNWTVASRGDFPADPAKVRKLVFELDALKVADAITGKKENYPKFGLSEKAGERATIRLKDAEGRDLKFVRMGREQRSMDESEMMMNRVGGRYFLIDDDPLVYLAPEELFWLNSRLAGWVDTEILSVPRSEIVMVKVDHGTTESLELRGPNGDQLSLSPLESGMRGKTSEINLVAGALSSLRLDDAFAADSEEGRKAELTVSYEALRNDGTLYRVRLGGDLLAIQAEYREPVFSDADQATTETLAAAQTRAEKAKEAVPAFNQKHGPWIYKISSWSHNNFTKKRSELMEPIAEEKPAEESPAAVRDDE